MAENDAPRIFADDWGVWFESGTGIGWDEIYTLTGSKLDGITEVYTSLTLDFEYGEYIELYDLYRGFTDVVSALTQRLSGIEPGWFQRVESLALTDPPIEVWRRS